MMEQGTYQIQVEGRIGERWAHWFEDMVITVHEQEQGPAVTTLTGFVADQAALHGLLQRLYTLQLAIRLVRRVEASKLDGANHGQRSGESSTSIYTRRMEGIQDE